MKSLSRRSFIEKTGQLACLLPLISFTPPFWSAPKSDNLAVNIFSKHLQFLNYKDAGEIAAEIGFSGIDLTVRRNGHVLPELVKTDLPKAVKEIKEAGSTCNLITTSIESVTNPLDIDILKTAANVGIKYYRTNWYKYPKNKTMQQALKQYQSEIKKLGILNKQLGLIGSYQNHAGTDIGSSFWEIKELLTTVDSNYFGTQYDIRHAMVEGGFSWQNGLKLLYPHLKTIVLKDFKWARVNGKWQIINTPIGKGMVDFNSYFKLLKTYQLQPPVSLHLEYDLGGAQSGKSKISIDKKLVFEAMKKDLSAVQKLWRKA
ncbi:sugar phosphate isomerase/epimerase [Aureibaculum marinum]|uniref:Sugar phosphate isomerase/epimerase n=1 Tax=Aureibaculum marinum TaxID=2487930 RepID=A0A3N4NF64_9FLAO|nr:sugar phosphate isomerase/epimerase family protein [Aureibaculum marinum]RPD93398.1 sugar phosphate isomerase/epimerase [Aureibaculum marinum]